MTCPTENEVAISPANTGSRKPQHPSEINAPPYPKIVYIEPTNACNCNCSICPRQNMRREIGMMKMLTFTTIVDEVAPWRPELRLFNFGEPLMHPGLGEMIRYAKLRGLAANFQTNGVLLDDNRSIALLESGVTYVGVSVNGLTESEYESIRPGCRLDDIRENVRHLRETAARMGISVHIHINAQILADESNSRRGDMERYIRYWEGIPDTLSVSGISLFDNIAVMKTGISSKISQSSLPRKDQANIVCTEPFDRLVIKWDGRITPCCADYDARLVLGQIGNQTLEEVWRGRTMADLRRMIEQKKYDSSELCRSCPKLYSHEFTMLFRKNINAQNEKIAK